MTEKEGTEKTAGKPWRCERCGSTIAITRNGECRVKSVVILGCNYTKVICLVCGRENRWHWKLED